MARTSSKSSGVNLSKTGKPNEPKKMGRPKLNDSKPTNEVLNSRLHLCSCCGHTYTTARNYFMVSSSQLYNGNEGYTSICKKCAVEYYDNTLLPLYEYDEMSAVRHMCMLLDWRWDEELFKMAASLRDARLVKIEQGKIKPSEEVIGDGWDKNKISCSLPILYSEHRGLRKFQRKGMTYLDTAKEQIEASKVYVPSTESSTAVQPIVRVHDEDVWFFGPGYSAEQYKYLREQYDDWTERYDCQSKAQEEIFKNLAIAQLNLQKAQQDGDSRRSTECMKTLQDLMNTAKIQPRQKEDKALVEQNTFGTLIQRWEEEHPIAEPAAEWRDVDGIRRYLTTWFFGHLCSMFKLDNDSSKIYEEEMEKYTVHPPTFAEMEEDNGAFDEVFKSYQKRPDQSGGDD